jgi:hypothetical protein
MAKSIESQPEKKLSIEDQRAHISHAIELSNKLSRDIAGGTYKRGKIDQINLQGIAGVRTNIQLGIAHEGFGAITLPALVKIQSIIEDELSKKQAEPLLVKAEQDLAIIEQMVESGHLPQGALTIAREDVEKIRRDSIIPPVTHEMVFGSKEPLQKPALETRAMIQKHSPKAFFEATDTAVESDNKAPEKSNGSFNSESQSKPQFSITPQGDFIVKINGQETAFNFLAKHKQAVLKYLIEHPGEEIPNSVIEGIVLFAGDFQGRWPAGTTIKLIRERLSHIDPELAKRLITIKNGNNFSYSLHANAQQPEIISPAKNDLENTHSVLPAISTQTNPDLLSDSITTKKQQIKQLFENGTSTSPINGDDIILLIWGEVSSVTKHRFSVEKSSIAKELAEEGKKIVPVYSEDKYPKKIIGYYTVDISQTPNVITDILLKMKAAPIGETTSSEHEQITLAPNTIPDVATREKEKPKLYLGILPDGTGITSEKKSDIETLNILIGRVQAEGTRGISHTRLMQILNIPQTPEGKNKIGKIIHDLTALLTESNYQISTEHKLYQGNHAYMYRLEPKTKEGQKEKKSFASEPVLDSRIEALRSIISEEISMDGLRELFGPTKAGRQFTNSQILYSLGSAINRLQYRINKKYTLSDNEQSLINLLDVPHRQIRKELSQIIKNKFSPKQPGQDTNTQDVNASLFDAALNEHADVENISANEPIIEESEINNEDIAIVKSWIRSRSGTQIRFQNGEMIIFKLTQGLEKIIENIPEEVKIKCTQHELEKRRKLSGEKFNKIYTKYLEDPTYSHIDKNVDELIMALLVLNDGLGGYLEAFLNAPIIREEAISTAGNRRYARYNQANNVHYWNAPDAMLRAVQERKAIQPIPSDTPENIHDEQPESIEATPLESDDKPGVESLGAFTSMPESGYESKEIQEYNRVKNAIDQVIATSSQREQLYELEWLLQNRYTDLGIQGNRWLAEAIIKSKSKMLPAAVIFKIFNVEEDYLFRPDTSKKVDTFRPDTNFGILDIIVAQRRREADIENNPLSPEEGRYLRNYLKLLHEELTKIGISYVPTRTKQAPLPKNIQTIFRDGRSYVQNRHIGETSDSPNHIATEAARPQALATQDVIFQNKETKNPMEKRDPNIRNELRNRLERVSEIIKIPNSMAYQISAGLGIHVQIVNKIINSLDLATFGTKSGRPLYDLIGITMIQYCKDNAIGIAGKNNLTKQEIEDLKHIMVEVFAEWETDKIEVEKARSKTETQLPKPETKRRNKDSRRFH